MGCRYLFNNFPFLSSFISFYLTQGHPTEASGIHSNNYPMTWIQRHYNKGPHSKCTFVLLHAPISTIQTSYLFIIPQHQPFIVSILPKDYLPTMLSYQ